VVADALVAEEAAARVAALVWVVVLELGSTINTRVAVWPFTRPINSEMATFGGARRSGTVSSERPYPTKNGLGIHSRDRAWTVFPSALRCVRTGSVLCFCLFVPLVAMGAKQRAVVRQTHGNAS